MLVKLYQADETKVSYVPQITWRLVITLGY